MNNIEISVVIPVYNTGEMLQETIDSVLSQTYNEFELIIVDDGSTDEVTAEILDRQRDERIRIIHQKNAGVAAARNQGFALAQGKHIAFLDHDDLFLPDKLAESLKIFRQHRDAVLVYSDTIPIGDFADRRIEMQKAEGRIFCTMIAQNPILSMSCSVVDKNFLAEHNIKFNSECVPCDDWDFHLQCALHGCIYCTAEPQVKYRYHDNNLSSDAVKMYHAGLKVIDKYQMMLSDISRQFGIPRRMLQKSINFIAFKHHYGLAFESVKSNEYKTAFKHIFKAFWYRPLKCPLKILHYIGKSAKKGFF